MIRNRFFIIFSGVLFAAIVILACAWGFSKQVLNTPSALGESQYLYIEPGDSVQTIAKKAESLGLVRQAWHFRLGARLLSLDARLRAGEYRFEPQTTLRDQLKHIVSGDVYYRRLSVPEGISTAQLEGLLIAAQGLDFTGYESPEEGSVLPDTYFYQRGEHASDLIRRMQLAQKEYLAEIWKNRSDAATVQTFREAVILASVVEKETALGSERPLVAAVFSNRLRLKMRLQSDPTVVYGITTGLPLGRSLTRADLDQQTPYNTYRIKGLPPAPIANPGREALAAVLSPADVDYLYFVADGSGGHAFARTLKEHNQNVARWRKIRNQKNN